MSVVLYTTGCPKCKILEKKLEQKNIDYEIFDDVDKMLEMGFQSVPLLELKGEYMNFTQALEWINKQ